MTQPDSHYVRMLAIVPPQTIVVSGPSGLTILKRWDSMIDFYYLGPPFSMVKSLASSHLNKLDPSNIVGEHNHFESPWVPTGWFLTIPDDVVFCGDRPCLTPVFGFVIDHFFGFVA